MQSIYSTLKVNNEFELCEIFNQECRQLIERDLLRNRISYFLRWPKGPLFGRHKDRCVLCVNENAIDQAEDLVRNICDEYGYRVKFLLRKSTTNYL